MDADLWSSRLAAAKRHHALQQSQHYQWDRLSADDFEVDDEVRPEFVCPYCYEDFEISALCSHLEEEHMYESKGVACPVCAAKISKDVVGHLTYQHAHLFKIQRRRRYRRSGLPLGSSFTLLGKELREAHLQALLGGVTVGNNAGGSGRLTNTTDSLLSTLAYSFPTSECEDLVKQTQCMDDAVPKAVLVSTKQHKIKLHLACPRQAAFLGNAWRERERRKRKKDLFTSIRGQSRRMRCTCMCPPSINERTKGSKANRRSLSS